MNLRPLLFPKSIAVIGASNDLKKWGGNVLFNLIHAGFTGKIYPINYKEDTIQNLKA